MAKNISNRRSVQARKARAKARDRSTLTRYSVTLFVKSNRVVQDVYARDGAEAVRRAKADFLAEVTADIRLANGLAQKIAQPVVPEASSLVQASSPVGYTVSARRAGKNAFAEAAAEVRESFDHPVGHTSGLRAAIAGEAMPRSEMGRIAKGTLGIDVTPEQDAVMERFETRREAEEAAAQAVLDEADLIVRGDAHEPGPKPGPAHVAGDKVWLISKPKTSVVHIADAIERKSLPAMAWCGVIPTWLHNTDLDDYANVNCPKCKAAVAANQTRSNRS